MPHPTNEANTSIKKNRLGYCKTFLNFKKVSIFLCLFYGLFCLKENRAA